ncbi:uncharacterized protein LOC114959565 isoform X1 [Acropora millepora]|uniref:uncharacterized protein LOC114959565 isoform X1 n=1 Tax=Acropora millepora TaxID=45264 RepID=UPI001CF4215A|nr:uncharacterized protein LOC114959565 isoform X1 [Acropora millepora]XP_044185229.1 uncharacterized protein LOC114959565 isoform X1 [Acropora millepora]
MLSARLRSYAVHEMLTRITVCVLLCFLACTVKELSASSTRLAASVTVDPFSTVFPTASSPTSTASLPSPTWGIILSTKNTSLQLSIQLTQNRWSIFPTPTASLPSPSWSVILPAKNTSFQLSIQLTKTPWSDELFNEQTPSFISLSSNLTSTISSVLKDHVGEAKVEVLEFKPGSVIAVFKVTALSSLESEIKNRIVAEMRDRKLGSFAVEPVPYSGAIFDVTIKINTACNDSAVNKGFVKKEKLENAIITNLVSSNKEFTAANIRFINCPQDANENITIVTARVQLNDLSAVNPSKVMRSLKSSVESGRVGNFSVVPEWKSFVPGEKLFHFRATVRHDSAHALQNKTGLEELIQERFKAKSNFRYVNLEIPNNTTLAFDIGMDSSTSELPFIALDALASDLRWSTLGKVKFFRNTIRVTVDPKSLTKKTFEVNFAQNVPNCNATEIANTSSFHYKNLSVGAEEFIDSTLRATHRKVKEFYLETEVQALRCHNVTTVRSVSYVYLKPNAEDKIGLLYPLLRCKVEPAIYDWGVKIQLKTPTTLDIRGSWNVLQGIWIHWVCPRPPKPKPPTQRPTVPTTTTGKPTNRSKISTTDSLLNETKSPATSKRPTTKETLSTSSSKTELFIKVDLGMTWREFCSKQGVFRERIAGILEDNNGTKLSPDRIVYVNVAENCADPNKQNELAEVWFYVSKAGSKDLDISLTLKAYELFVMFFENANTKPLGPDFEEKVIKVVLAGTGAAKYKKDTDCGLSSRSIILIAVAAAVGLFLMLLACCCLFCCSKRRASQSQYKYDSKQHHAMHIIHVDAGVAKVNEDREKNTNKNKDVELQEKDGAGDYKRNCRDGCHKNDGVDGVQDERNNNKSNDETGNNFKEVAKESHVNIFQNVSGKEKVTEKEIASSNVQLEGNGPADALRDIQSHSYEELGTSNAGSHTHDAMRKSSESVDKNSSTINVSSVPAVFSPVSCVVNVDSVDDEGRNNKGIIHNSSTSAAIKGPETMEIGSQYSSVYIKKLDADPKNQERRGSNVQPLTDEDVPLTHKTGTVGIVALAIRNKNENKKETEFKNLSRDMPFEDVKYPSDTAIKNRYPDVLPASTSRVKLSTQPDYINANWIRDHKGKRRYIATQHPLQETMGDFWRMVWDQRANVVVMVNDEEKDKPADFSVYLPKGEGHSMRYGSIDVTVNQITDKGDYVMSVLSIAETKQTESPREVTHMKFSSWKGRLMPNVALFVGFVMATKEARKKYGDTNAPVIVHCSDGLGFTGVYIALDIGIMSHEESKTSIVDVFELSKSLRRDRHGIVSSLDRYNFIYQALYEYTVNCDKSN